MTGPAVTVDTYTVHCEHADYDGPLIMDIAATSEAAALSRARGTAYHRYRDMRWLKATYTVTRVRPGTAALADNRK